MVPDPDTMSETIESIPEPLRVHVFAKFIIRYSEAGSTEFHRSKCKGVDLYSGCAAWLKRMNSSGREYTLMFNDADYTCDAWFSFSATVIPSDLGDCPEVWIKFD